MVVMLLCVVQQYERWGNQFDGVVELKPRIGIWRAGREKNDKKTENGAHKNLRLIKNIEPNQDILFPFQGLNTA